jgi:hypothetical protein
MLVPGSGELCGKSGTENEVELSLGMQACTQRTQYPQGVLRIRVCAHRAARAEVPAPLQLDRCHPYLGGVCTPPLGGVFSLCQAV